MIASADRRLIPSFFPLCILSFTAAGLCDASPCPLFLSYCLSIFLFTFRTENALVSSPPMMVKVYPNLIDPERFKDDVLPTAFQYDDERSQVATELGL